MAQKIRIGALISGGGTNLQAIIDACEKGKINGELVFVGSDNPSAGGLSNARSLRIPTFIVNYAFFTKQFKENPTGAILPKDFDLEEIYAKQFLISHKTDPDKIRFYLQSRAMAEACKSPGKRTAVTPDKRSLRAVSATRKASSVSFSFASSACILPGSLRP